jgi:hypothetical protein
VFKIELDPTREERLSQSTVQDLMELIEVVSSERRWPGSKDSDES